MTNANSSTVISFPRFEGQSYPRLDAENVVRFVADPDALLKLPAVELAHVRVLMTSATRGCSAAIARAMPNLGLVVSQGVGVDRIDLAFLKGRGIRVRPVGEALTEDVADIAMALLQMTCRQLVRADAFARCGEWQKKRFDPPGESLVDKVVGIGGLSGRIGQAIARRAVASRMKVVGLRRASNAALGVPLYDNWLAMAQASDVLMLAVPGTSETKHIVGAAELSALGSKGFLVNVGRGDAVDTDALIAALEQGVIAGAGLDVLEGEPVVPPRLSALSNVTLSPHIAGATWGARARGAKIAEDEVLAFLRQ
jgi:glyoxylate reductase/hydroxypyruvate reductase 2